MAYGDWINECIDDKPFLNFVQHEIIKQVDKVLNSDNPFQRKWMYGRFANLRCRLFKADRLERKLARQWRLEHPIQLTWQPRNLAG